VEHGSLKISSISELEEDALKYKLTLFTNTIGKHSAAPPDVQKQAQDFIDGLVGTKNDMVAGSIASETSIDSDGHHYTSDSDGSDEGSGLDDNSQSGKSEESKGEHVWKNIRTAQGFSKGKEMIRNLAVK
jgi:hypothetical protein